MSWRGRSRDRSRGSLAGEDYLAVIQGLLTAGYSMWVGEDVSAGPVASWAARGTSETVTQATESKRPVAAVDATAGNRITLSLDTVNERRLNVTSFTTPVTQPFTAYAVALNNAAASSQTLFQGEASSSTDAEIARHSSEDATLRPSAGTARSISAVDLNNWHIYTWLANGASGEFWNNGTSADSGNYGTDGINGIQIGANKGDIQWWDGKIACLILDPSAATNRAPIEAALNSHYSLGVLP